MKPSNLVLEGLVFSSSRYVLIGLSLIRNLVIARFLGPEDYGYWVIISLLLTYGDQLHLGLRHAGDREIPFLRGQDQEQKSYETAKGIFGGILILAAVGAALIFSYLLLDTPESVVLKRVFAAAALILVSDQVSRFYFMILRTQKEFILSSKLEAGFELVRTIMVCSLVITFGLEGAIHALLVASGATTIYFLLMWKSKFSPIFEWRILRRCLGLGFPLFLSGLFYLVMISLDRIFGAFVLEKKALGSYGLATLLAQLPLSATLAVATVLYPKFSELIGAQGSVKAIEKLYGRVLVNASYLTPFLVTGFLFSCELFVRMFLPEYLDSWAYLRILVYGMFFIVLIPFPLFLLMAAGRKREYLEAQIVGVVTATGLYVTLLYLMDDTVAIPIAAVASYALSSILLTFRSFSVFDYSLKDSVKRLVFVLIPALVSIIAAYATQKYGMQVHIETVGDSLTKIIMNLAMFVLLYSPCLLLLKFRNRLWGESA